MTLALWSLFGFTVWTVLLILVIVIPRVVLTLQGRKRANEFEPSAATESAGFAQRAGRAHANCIENLPVFATLVLVGHINGAAATGAFGTIAFIVLGARVAQGVAHLISISELAVNIRFSFFVGQVGCFLALAGLIATA